MAARFGRNGELGAHAWLVDKALRRYNEVVSADSRVANQRGLSLNLADEVLYGPQPADAAPLITYFSEAVAPTLRGHGDDRRHLANFAMCQGSSTSSAGTAHGRRRPTSRRSRPTRMRDCCGVRPSLRTGS